MRQAREAILAMAVIVAGMAVVAVPAAPAGEAALPALRVVVNCYTNPERTAIKNNNRTTAITIRTVGSIYRPYNFEPFSVNRRLPAGRWLTFFTGPKAGVTNPGSLSQRYIYHDGVGTREGARVTSSAGTFGDRC